MKLYTLIFVSILAVAGCTSSGDSDQLPNFEGRWKLIDYTLDDGTKKFVPDEVNVGLFVTSSSNIGIQHALCGSYTSSYRLDNNVLTTFDHISPETSCTALYVDGDNTERSGLVLRAFLDSETLIDLSADSLVVTTLSNEILQFDRTAL